MSILDRRREEEKRRVRARQNAAKITGRNTTFNNRILGRQKINKVAIRNANTHARLLQKQRVIEPPKKFVERTETIISNPGDRFTTQSITTSTTFIPNNFSSKSRLVRRSGG